MPFLTNSWVRYYDRTYQQIKTQVLTNLQAAVAEMTDHTESNIFVKIVSIFAGIAEMLGYYIDNAAREAFITSFRLYASGIKLARLMDYRVRGCIAATVDLTFVLDVAAPSGFTIPTGTEVKTADGLISFFTTADAIFSTGDTEQTVPATNAKNTNASFNLGGSNGTANQEFRIIPDPTIVVDNSLTLQVGVTGVWGKVDTLAYEGATRKAYVFTVNEDGDCIAMFGDSVAGLIPANGDIVSAEYFTCDREAGNVGVGTLTQHTFSGNPGGTVLTVTNRSRAVGGQGVESIEQLKSRIPKSIRTLNRAVTRQDFIDIAELAPGVIRAAVDFICGQTVDVYIYPDGGGVASGTLLTDTQAFIEARKIVTTNLRTFAAGEITFKFNIDIQILNGYSRAAMIAAVKANLVAFFLPTNQRIRGSVELGDIYQVVEDTDGVDFSRVNLMNPVPYAKPIDPSFGPLSWTPVIKIGSVSTIEWLISFTSSTTYELYKGGAFQGVFNAGTNYTSFAELDINVANTGHAVGDQWSFVTYPYFGSVQLEELSIPVTSVGDIVINATGGVA